MACWAKRKAEAEVNALAPLCLSWSGEKVAHWIEEIGFPQYKDCFVSNFIDGRRLIYLDMSTLPRIGITDYAHLKVIAHEIREILELPAPDYHRSLARPHRDIMGLFLERKARSGKRADALTYSVFLRDVHKIKDFDI